MVIGSPQPQTGPGGITDAAGAFGSAVVGAAEAVSTQLGDPRVSAAFVLGWQMAELYRPNLRRTSVRVDDDLPGLGALSTRDRLEILVDQIEAGVTKLAEPVWQAGLAPISLLALRVSLDGDDFQQQVLVLHRTLLGTLTAADFRLGKAYALGRALADTCRKPKDMEGLRKEFGTHRIATLRGWLDELSSALPAHAAHSVAASLGRWSVWISAHPRETPLAQLQRQGELWRALLSGEKRGNELLEFDNYLDASGALASRMAANARRAITKFWLLIVVIAALIVGGIVLLVIGGSSQIVAGATSLIAAVGLTWKGVGSAVGQLVGRLEQPVWGAVLDVAIADAITLLPGNQGDKGGRRKLAIEMAQKPKGHAADADAKRAS
jgi:hypothetical protein